MGDERLGRAIAIKLMSPELVDDAEYRERFEQEARAAAKLRSRFSRPDARHARLGIEHSRRALRACSS